MANISHAVTVIPEEEFKEIGALAIKYKNECQSHEVINEHLKARELMKSTDVAKRKEAVLIYLDLYKGGDAVAADILADKYYSGDASIGIEKDVNKAFILEENAANQGYVPSVLQITGYLQVKDSAHYDPKAVYEWSMVGLILTAGKVSLFTKYMNNIYFKSPEEQVNSAKLAKEKYKNILAYQKSNCKYKP